MKGSRLDSGSGTCKASTTTDNELTTNTNTTTGITITSSGGNTFAKSKTVANNSAKSSILLEENSPQHENQPQHVHRPRPGHPLTLISFPSTSITSGNNSANNPGATTCVLNNSYTFANSYSNNNVGNSGSSSSSSKVFGRISTGRELQQGERPEEETIGESGGGGVGVSNGSRSRPGLALGIADGWISSAESQRAKFFRVPKPSHSAKKLAKPYSTILVPSSANANTLADRRCLSSSKTKFKINPYFSTAFLGAEQHIRGDGGSTFVTSPSASSNNIIDNKIGYKPKRNKTASTPTLRKGVNSGMSKLKKTGLLSPPGFSHSSSSGKSKGNNKVVNSEGDSKELFKEQQENSRQQHEQQQQSDLNLRVMSGSTGKVLSGIVSSNGNMSMSSLPSTMTKFNERFQVNRTPEEREKSPESIHLDGMALKAFPFIGGGEGPSLKLLSLQRNLITRLENVPSQLNHLVVLDLYDNRLERITGLQGFPALRVLLLGKNRIRRIEGLEGLKRLEILDLHGNQLRYVDNLSSLSALRVLNLAGNLLRSIRNLGPYGLSSLSELNLKRNRLRNLDGLAKTPHLKKLLLANNDLQSFACLLPLRKLVFLQELLLEPNPLCSVGDFRSQVLTVFPWLITLDRCSITDLMRLEARQWHRRKLLEEEERRKEEARLRAGSPTAAGPPGSREQVIYQARRRWESVKNFVKNSNSKPTNPSSSSSSSLLKEKNKKVIVAETIVASAIDGMVVRPSEIDDDKDQRTLSQSQKSSKELLEYPGGEVRLNLAQLDLDLDLDQKREEESILVSSSGEPMPGDPCPPSMINDQHPVHPKDYVNNNLPYRKVGPSNTKEVEVAVEEKVVETLSSENSQMDSSIITNMKEVRVEESSQSPCQQPQVVGVGLGGPGLGMSANPLMMKMMIMMERNINDTPSSFYLTGDGGDDGDQGKKLCQRKEEEDKESRESNIMIEETSSPPPPPLGSSISCNSEKSMRIAVVRPLLRESNLDETISSHLLNTNSSSSGTFTMSNPLQLEPPPPPPILLPPDSSPKSKSTIPSTSDHNTSHELTKSKSNNEDQINVVTQQSNHLCDMIPNQKLSPPEDSSELDDKNRIVECDTSFGNTKEEASSISDVDFDNIINNNNNKKEGMTKKCGNVSSKRNMLRRSVSTCLMPIPSLIHEEENKAEELQEEIICPTFVSQAIDKETTCMNIMNIDKMNKTEGMSESITAKTATTTTTSTTSSTTTPLETNVSIRRNNKKPHLRKLRSASFDGRIIPSSPPESDDDYDYDDDTCSIATSTATTSDVSPRNNKSAFGRKQLFPRTKSQRLKLRQDRVPRIQSSSSVTSRNRTGGGMGSSSGGITRFGTTADNSSNNNSNKQMRRCDSAIAGGLTGSSPLENSGGNNSCGPLKKQGTDYLVEIDGKCLSIYGQGALKHTLTGFTGNVTLQTTTAKFHYISYDSIIPYFGKLRQIYPSLEHFQFRANNISRLSQLNALSDLQGLTSLHVAKEGNPLVSQDSFWVHYASYRLSHWGLQNVNGKEVRSEYRGGQTTTSKCFESLGFLALSCLPQTALTPLAKRLHMLHCFCCCSPSSSSDESGRGKGNNKGGNSGRPGSPNDQTPSSSGNICSSWEDDPVLLDVIGKEALVYCPPLYEGERALSPSTMIEESDQEEKRLSSNGNKIGELLSNDDGRRRRNTLKGIVDSGVEILEKLDMLEKTWPSLMTEIIQEILMDYMYMDTYMKKELKKCQDATTIAIHNNKKSHHHH